MKSIIIAMLAVATFIGVATATVPPEVRGENFQRIQLIDCQTFREDAWRGVHSEINQTVCFTALFIIKKANKFMSLWQCLANKLPFYQGTYNEKDHSFNSSSWIGWMYI